MVDKIPMLDLSYGDEQLKEMANEVYNRMPSKSQSVDAIFAHLKNGRRDLYKNFYITEYPYDCTKEGCPITVIDSVTPKNKQPFIQKDHAFLGDTYQVALTDNIDKFREGYRIYNGKSFY